MSDMAKIISSGFLVLLVPVLMNVLSGRLSGIFHIQELYIKIFLMLPIAGLLFRLTLPEEPSLRLKFGWRSAGIFDILAILVLTLFTLSMGLVLPRRADTGIPLSLPLIPVLILAVLSALAEELYFRSWLLTKLTDCVPYTAVGFSTAGFACMHIWQGWQAVVFAAITGIVYSLYFLNRRCIAALIAAHSLHNVVVVLYSFGLPTVPLT
ncbi:MAG: hypothetical protein B0D92_08755 [Spirochaeta sp. LUC14_002_19_P3]|nr:MAG: hypothetical protein B0D92_08755 [Spirochaeta sp. LUC14_002_19_P3]